MNILAWANAFLGEGARRQRLDDARLGIVEFTPEELGWELIETSPRRVWQHAKTGAKMMFAPGEREIFKGRANPEDRG
jgi:hypothetical protein